MLPAARTTTARRGRRRAFLGNVESATRFRHTYASCMRRSIRQVVVAAVLTVAAIAGGAPRADAAVLTARVTRIVDGDTIKVVTRGFDDTVRFIGIDTPERGRCYAREATARLAGRIPVGASVRLETDPTQKTRDRYGRLLAYVYRGERSDAASVNRALVALGAARVYVYNDIPFRFAAAFRAAERSARAANAGLWGPPCRGRTSAPNVVPIIPLTAASAGAGTNCHPSYSPCVQRSATDLDCADIRKPVIVTGSDPYRLDQDGDGRACESYG